MQLRSKSTLNIFNLWGLRKIENSKSQQDKDSCRAGANQLQDESSYRDDFDLDDSLEGFKSDGDSEECDLIPVAKAQNGQIKRGRSSIDLKAAQLAYYRGVNESNNDDLS